MIVWPLLSLALLPSLLALSTERKGRQTSEFETQLERLLETSGDLTLVQIREKVDELVAGTDEETRKNHEAWKVEQHKRDNARRERIKNALLSLSRPAQAKLLRVIFIQEDEELTQNEKRSRLNEISRSLPSEIRRELVDKLKDADIFAEFGFFQ